MSKSLKGPFKEYKAKVVIAVISDDWPMIISNLKSLLETGPALLEN